MDDFRKRFWLYYTDYNRTIILIISGQMLLVVVDNYTSFSLWFIYFPDFFHFFYHPLTMIELKREHYALMIKTSYRDDRKDKGEHHVLL